MKQIDEREGITEGFKEHNQMVWVGRINNIRN
ncbi:MAG: TnpV protein, partial [Clostridia bacterium]